VAEVWNPRAVPLHAVLAEDACFEECLHQRQDAFIPDAHRTRSMRAACEISSKDSPTYYVLR
jgi:hypothetical protein